MFERSSASNNTLRCPFRGGSAVGSPASGRRPLAVVGCEAMQERWTASKCPTSVSPHAGRRRSITHQLTEDVPEQVVSDRMNVGMDVLDKHYNRRSKEVKMEQRRGISTGCKRTCTFLF